MSGKNKTITAELTNMVMVYDDAGRALVQERRLSWKGISFPGGHIEPNESIVQSAVREIREETGLTVTDLRCCGVTDWLNTDNGDRYLVFLFKTNRFSSELLPETEEGRVFWMDIEELKALRSANGFEKYLPVFLSDEHSEAFGAKSWSQSGDSEDEIIYF